MTYNFPKKTDRIFKSHVMVILVVVLNDKAPNKLTTDSQTASVLTSFIAVKL